MKLPNVTLLLSPFVMGTPCTQHTYESDERLLD